MLNDTDLSDLLSRLAVLLLLDALLHEDLIMPFWVEKWFMRDRRVVVCADVFFCTLARRIFSGYCDSIRTLRLLINAPFLLGGFGKVLAWSASELWSKNERSSSS